jgi:outer membrane lipoprotein-sorting protein
MRLHHLPFVLVLLALAAPLPAPAEATRPPAAAPAPTQAADLQGIENYLNGLTTAQADFSFAGPDGTISRGTFYLSRPAKLRFDYAEPKGNLLIADGDYVIFYDAKQKEASNLPISSTPLAFLLRPKVSLTDGVKVTGFEHSAGAIRATLVRSKSEGDGSVTVAFGDNPIELRGWRLVDGQGQTTDVSFSNWKFGMPLDQALFHFVDPTRSGKRGR